MSLTNSGKSFSPFLSQHYQKKPNETNNNRFTSLSSNDRRSEDKFTTGPPPKSPQVNNDPWHLGEKKGQYIIITQHKTTSPFITPTYSQITSLQFELYSAAVAAVKIFRKLILTPIPMVIQNTKHLNTLPEEVIQPQVHPAAPETSSLSDSKQKNSDETQRKEKISRVQDSDPSQSHDADNKLDDNNHCDNDTTESQNKKKKKKKGHTVYQPTNHKVIRDALIKITRQYRIALLQLKITRFELAHKEGYSDPTNNKKQIIIIFIFIFTFTSISILTFLTNFQYNNTLDRKLLFFT